MAIRLSIRSLEQSSSSIDVLRAAYANLKSVTDERGFDWFAATHGAPTPIWCPHGSLIFLPWHRAFLYYFELALQTRLGPRFTEVAPARPEFADVGLPWWDWASDHSHNVGLPQSYALANVGGQPNPLASSEIGSPSSQFVSGVWSDLLVNIIRTNPRFAGVITDTDPPTTLRDPDDPDNLPRQNTIRNVLMTMGTFTDFTTSVEQMHDDVHGWVGGAMSSVPTSAYDPIFWSHHCMIDRLWHIWQNSSNAMDPPPDLMDTVLAPFPLTVAQVLDIDRMGYEYAVAAVA